MIRFGVIGRNFVTDWMMSAMAALPELVKPTAIYSRRLSDAEAFAEKYGLSFACDDLTQLASAELIDAVYIASPNAFHYEQAKLFLEHGKHVLCEKPAAANADQVKELVRLAEEKGPVFLEAIRPVFNGSLDIVKEHLPEIGQLRQVRFDLCKTSSRLKRFYAGEAVNAFDPSLSNAAIMDLGCYGIHSIIRLFGKPEAVSAQSIHLENGFEALGTVLMRYPGFLAEASYSKFHLLDTPCTLAGEKGTIYLDNINDTERIWMRIDGGEETDLGYQGVGVKDMVFELRAFYRFVTEVIRPAEENRASIETAEVIDEARKLTGTVFPSDKN